MPNALYSNTSSAYLDDLKRPKGRRPFQVIGAGLSRTGTLSFTVAIEKLLRGPVCHGGSVILSREEPWMKSWISILDPKPPNTSHAYIVDTLQNLLKGYVGVTDVPCIYFVEELCEAFPDAIVICTTRDADKWWASMEPVVKAVTPWWLPVVFWSTATLRYFGDWLDAMRKRIGVIYGPNFDTKEINIGLLETHNQYLKRVTPPERLHFYNVKDGWAPLCKILNVPIPDEPFPHINDADQVQKDILNLIIKGLLGWLQIFGVIGAVIALMVYALK